MEADRVDTTSCRQRVRYREESKSNGKASLIDGGEADKIRLRYSTPNDLEQARCMISNLM